MTRGKFVAALILALPEAFLGAYYRLMLGGPHTGEGFSWPVFVVLYPLFVWGIFVFLKNWE